MGPPYLCFLMRKKGLSGEVEITPPKKMEKYKYWSSKC